jgi:hypothetical protein
MLSAAVTAIFNNLLAELAGLGKKYIDKQITEVEYRRQTELAVTKANEAIRLAEIEAQARMFSEVQQSVRANATVARSYAATIVLGMIVWTFGTIGVGLWQVVTGIPFPAFDQVWAVGSASALIVFALGGGTALLRR